MRFLENVPYLSASEVMIHDSRIGDISSVHTFTLVCFVLASNAIVPYCAVNIMIGMIIIGKYTHKQFL